MVFDECRLLIGRQLHHPELIVVMQRRKDPLVDAEVRMPHVRAFHGAIEGQGNAAKTLCGYRLESATEQILPRAA